MTIENRTLHVGDRFIATYKKERFVVAFLDFPEGKKPFAVEDGPRLVGNHYSTLSAAGKAIMGGIACNGWAFFDRDDGSPAPGAAAPTPKAPKPGRAKKEPVAKKPAATKPDPKPRAPRRTKIVDGGTRQVWDEGTDDASAVAEAAELEARAEGELIAE